MVHLCHRSHYKSTAILAQVVPTSAGSSIGGDPAIRAGAIGPGNYPAKSPNGNDSGSEQIDSGLSEKVKFLAALIGSRGYVTFAEIEERVGISMHEAIALKPALEAYMRLDIMSLVILDPPGFFMER